MDDDTDDDGAHYTLEAMVSTASARDMRRRSRPSATCGVRRGEERSGGSGAAVGTTTTTATPHTHRDDRTKRSIDRRAVRSDEIASVVTTRQRATASSLHDEAMRGGALSAGGSEMMMTLTEMMSPNTT